MNSFRNEFSSAGLSGPNLLVILERSRPRILDARTNPN